MLLQSEYNIWQNLQEFAENQNSTVKKVKLHFSQIVGKQEKYELRHHMS
jgi:hypothetical protein